MNPRPILLRPGSISTALQSRTSSLRSLLRMLAWPLVKGNEDTGYYYDRSLESSLPPAGNRA